MSSSLIYGIGVNDRKYPAKVNGKNTREYALWQNLLKRCYNPKYQRTQPTYIGCSVSKNFRKYSYFYEWARQQIGFNQEVFQLDKDLLIKGNKLYSEDACLFLPRSLNSLLNSNKATRGNLPVGVSAKNGKFQVGCNTDKSSRYAGFFDTPEEAFAAYKRAKETFIKLQAEKWKAHIDPRAFAALMAYEVQITD